MYLLDIQSTASHSTQDLLLLNHSTQRTSILVPAVHQFPTKYVLNQCSPKARSYSAQTLMQFTLLALITSCMNQFDVTCAFSLFAGSFVDFESVFCSYGEQTLDVHSSGSV